MMNKLVMFPGECHYCGIVDFVCTVCLIDEKGFKQFYDCCEDCYREDSGSEVFEYWCSECDSEYSSEIPLDDDVKRVCPDCRL